MTAFAKIPSDDAQRLVAAVQRLAGQPRDARGRRQPWRGGADDLIQYGTATADSTGATQITLTPCKAWNDSTATGEANILCDLAQPHGNAGPTAVLAGDILAYYLKDSVGNDGDPLGQLVAIPRPSGFFPVTLTNDGGVAGDATTACTFTYTVNDLRGATLGTAVAAWGPRFAMGLTYTAATKGMCAFDPVGNLLLMPFEAVATQACSGG